MLEIRPNYEHCNKGLSFNTSVVIICLFKCTCWIQHVAKLLEQVGTNSRGGFTIRPIRSANLFEKYLISTIRFFKSGDLELHKIE